MCCIAGFFGNRDIPDIVAKQCLAEMRRRGPNAASFRRFETVSGRRALLLHSRLSIIDLDQRSNQPFRVADKWLSYNGELYNYVEVARTLERRGVVFKTTSDTEVLLTAIDRDGIDVLDRCEGMWAFALFDGADGSLTLCRDRFGEKPLYIVHASEGLYFASEVKFLFALMGRRLPINRRHLMRYLTNGYKAIYKGEDCFFEGLS